MICWSFKSSRRTGNRVVRSASVLRNDATASILALWPICPVQASAYNSSCMYVGSSVTRLTASGRSRRERLPAFVLPWARLTVRLCEAFQSLGLATSGELGTRLAERLAIQTSPTTILRRLMKLPTGAVKRPSVVGENSARSSSTCKATKRLISCPIGRKKPLLLG